jgi:hypothetical protein
LGIKTSIHGHLREFKIQTIALGSCSPCPHQNAKLHPISLKALIVPAFIKNLSPMTSPKFKASSTVSSYKIQKESYIFPRCNNRTGTRYLFPF